MALPLAGASGSQERALRHVFSQYLEPKSGALASSLTQKIRRSKGDAYSIMAIVGEAEAADIEPQLLNKILDEAMSSFGPVALRLAFQEYCELCVKRLQLLSTLDPREALLFARFLKKKDFCQQDARTHCACAQLELRAGRLDKAQKVLEDALARGATPVEPLRAMLSQLLEASGTPEGGFMRDAALVPAASSGGSTPVRPRALRYSGGYGAAEDGDHGAARDPSTAADWVRRSSLDNLSPIVEADSVDQSNLNESAMAFDSFQRRHSAGQRPPAAEQVAAPLNLPMQTQSASSFHVPATGETPDSDFAENSEGVSSGHSPKVADRGSSPMAPIDDGDSDSSMHSVDVATGEARPERRPLLVNGAAYFRRKTLGRGGSSKVYLVEDPSGTLVALKRVSASCKSHFEALANEVTLLQQLKHSPSVIQVLDAEVNKERGMIQIVMEKGDIDLKDFLESEQNLSLGDVQILWRQILEAVQVIHSERIVHSDLKPANFLLVNGHLKLCDFGIAKRMPMETTHISREASVGTISYMAPEAVKQGSLKLGRSSDIWSLGIILYQMVYQRAPFAHLEPMQRIFQLTDPDMAMTFPPEHRLDGHSEETKASLMDVLDRCLQRDPRRRPSIPQLLQHPFLHDNITLSRCAFDRTLHALFSGFCDAVRSTMAPDGEADAVSAENLSPGLDSPSHEQWQLLSDAVWDSMSKGGSGGVRKRHASHMEGSRHQEVLGVAQYKQVIGHWLRQSGGKRQRLDTDTFEDTSDGASASVPAVSSKVVRPKLASRPPPPPLPGKGAGKSFGPGKGAGKSSMQKPFAPLQTSNFSSSGLGNTTGKGQAVEKVVIHAGLLQERRAGLKKVVVGGDTGSKENVGPNLGGMSHENLVMQRIKQRRQIVADDLTEEFTQTTGWLTSPKRG